MLLSVVSVLVVAQSSSEIPEGLMNNPVFWGINKKKYCYFFKNQPGFSAKRAWWPVISSTLQIPSPLVWVPKGEWRTLVTECPFHLSVFRITYVQRIVTIHYKATLVTGVISIWVTQISAVFNQSCHRVRQTDSHRGLGSVCLSVLAGRQFPCTSYWNVLHKLKHINTLCGENAQCSRVTSCDKSTTNGLCRIKDT